METIRYHTYTLEKSFSVGEQSRKRLADARLYVLVTESGCKASLYGTVAEALAGGAHVIQLREKNVADRIVLERAREIRKMTRSAGAIFIMNDRPDLARLVEADGVHLGQDDLPPAAARPLLRAGMIMGISTHSLSQAHAAERDGADYVAIGAMFPTGTKPAFELVGPAAVRQLRREVEAPLIGIGGITVDTAGEVIRAGADGVAVVSAVCAAADPEGATRRLVEAILAARAR
jgi:thiamine-phosphate pyrophosphorylase